MVAALRPELGDPAGLIAAGRVEVEGIAVVNPRSQVRAGASVVIRTATPLRGEAKLRGALEAFEVPVKGRAALDVGASAGGFTRVLLDAGARVVYAVDAGHGQLLGSLRQDPRVVNLEATNVAVLDHTVIPEPIEVITIDVSYLSLSAAAAQLGRITIAESADLVGLIKPMFELRLPEPPRDPAQLAAAGDRAAQGLRAAGWSVVGIVDSPVAGAGGAVEMLIHCRRHLATTPVAV